MSTLNVGVSPRDGRSLRPEPVRVPRPRARGRDRLGRPARRIRQSSRAVPAAEEHVAVAVIHVQTDVADAQWRWILVYAHGTPRRAARSRATSARPSSGTTSTTTASSTRPTTSSSARARSQLPGPALVSARSTCTRPAKIVTAPLAAQPQRYFIAYRMSSTARPTDSRPSSRARWRGPAPDVAADAVSRHRQPLPQRGGPAEPVRSASPVPFGGKLRAIIAAPQVMFVKATRTSRPRAALSRRRLWTRRSA